LGRNIKCTTEIECANHQTSHSPTPISVPKQEEKSQALFRNTRPVPVVVAAAALAGATLVDGFFAAAAPVTPLLIVLITVRFAGADGPVDLTAAVLVVLVAAEAGFLTTVEVLPSLDSLMLLTLSVFRVAAPLPGNPVAAGVTAAARFLVLVAAVALEEFEADRLVV
jgi:hypothetical protein